MCDANAALRPKLRALLPQDLANLTWAVAKLGPPVHVPLLEALLQGSAQLLIFFEPRHLGVMIWGLARCRVVPPEEWVEQFLDQVYALLPELDWQSTAQVGGRTGGNEGAIAVEINVPGLVGCAFFEFMCTSTASVLSIAGLVSVGKKGAGGAASLLFAYAHLVSEIELLA